MSENNKKDQKTFYLELFQGVDESERQLVDRLIDELIYLEDEMERLKELPFVGVNPKNPAMQRATPAAKLYKDFLGQYQNGLRILLNILRKVETSAQDELLQKLERFR